MARNKVKLQRIANDAQRRATFRKRLKGLSKKASELATLCSVDACLVVYGEGEAEAAEVWPSAPEARGVLERFKAMPQLDRYKKMTDLEGLLRQRVEKLQEQLHRARIDADQSETKLLLAEALQALRGGGGGGCGLERLTIEQLTSVGWMAGARLRTVSDRLETLRGQAALVPSVPTTTTTQAPDHLLGMVVSPHAITGYTAMAEDVGLGGTAAPSGDMDMVVQASSSGTAGFSWASQGFFSFPSM
ncbi:agamous-like MADS-box protein AGL80 [Oryza brachyantha]|uniref:agamous-like MADS-box protein AGL80 n=1 Tax=Oryza brachyantha TaxID=4533 RepID=UPI001ADCB90B|nr:agamous-like MADS-box protein AGL80 [Oryza brachyantha]